MLRFNAEKKSEFAKNAEKNLRIILCAYPKKYISAFSALSSFFSALKNSVFFGISLFMLTACGSTSDDASRTWREKNGKVKVLSTTCMINSLVSQIGNGYIDTLVLIRGELDPHSYQLVKGDDEKFTTANVIFYHGLSLEHGASLQQLLLNSPKAVTIGDKIREENPGLILVYHGTPDPHIWMDISIWKKAVPIIVEALSKQDPQHAAEYRANGERLEQEMQKSHEKILDEMQKVPENKRYLVTSHDAFNYFTRTYLAEEGERKVGKWQLRNTAPEGLAPESQISTADIQSVIDHMLKNNIHVIFAESNVSKDSINKILDAGTEKGMNIVIAPVVLYADAMGPSGSSADTYLKMIEHDARVIAAYMKDPHHTISDEP